MKGLSFSEPMVKAWLAGNKTVTRRLMKPQPVSVEWWLHGERTEPGIGGYLCRDENGTGWSNCGKFKPRYTPGETVYIKEAWAKTKVFQDPTEKDWIVYRTADNTTDYGGPWNSPRFMPEWASRSHARIVSVRPERVKDITEKEAKKEGMPLMIGFTDPGFSHPPTRRDQFRALWESLRPGSWDQNPWVWRIELSKEGLWD